MTRALAAGTVPGGDPQDLRNVEVGGSNPLTSTSKAAGHRPFPLLQPTSTFLAATPVVVQTAKSECVRTRFMMDSVAPVAG